MRLPLAFFILIGCASQQCPSVSADPRNVCDHGIPNLMHFSDNHTTLYRGGQPEASGWQYLAGLGVTTDIKLNDPVESFGQGEDTPATDSGITVVSSTIHPIDYGLDLRSPEQLFEAPTVEEAASIIATMATVRGPVFVHCTHGRDRTGLVVALYRVFVDGVSPSVARTEMVRAGFRSVNYGLDHFWNRLFVSGSLADRSSHQIEFLSALESNGYHSDFRPVH